MVTATATAVVVIGLGAIAAIPAVLIGFALEDALWARRLDRQISADRVARRIDAINR